MNEFSLLKHSHTDGKYINIHRKTVLNLDARNPFLMFVRTLYYKDPKEYILFSLKDCHQQIVYPSYNFLFFVLIDLKQNTNLQEW